MMKMLKPFRNLAIIGLAMILGDIILDGITIIFNVWIQPIPTWRISLGPIALILGFTAMIIYAVKYRPEPDIHIS